MIMDKVMMDVKTFKDQNGTQRWYIAYMSKGQYVRAWELPDANKDRIETVNVSVTNIPKEELKSLKIWELLPEETQNKINGVVVEEVPKIENVINVEEAVTNKNTSAKSGERTEEDMETVETVETVETAGATETTGIVEATIKVEKKRGRKPCADLVGVPRVIKCSCGVETHVNPRVVLEQATKAGQTVADWVAAYKCRKCRG